jgi:fused-like protein
MIAVDFYTYTNKHPQIHTRICEDMLTCKHTDFFYEPLEQHGILSEVVTCAADQDASTRKFACFAIGNAAFHR